MTGHASTSKSSHWNESCYNFSAIRNLFYLSFILPGNLLTESRGRDGSTKWLKSVVRLFDRWSEAEHVNSAVKYFYNLPRLSNNPVDPVAKHDKQNLSLTFDHVDTSRLCFLQCFWWKWHNIVKKVTYCRGGGLNQLRGFVLVEDRNFVSDVISCIFSYHR